MPGDTRKKMEQAMGQDFGDVRIHSADLVPLNVEAATRGSDIYFDRGGDQFDTPKSMSLLGHELTHVSQSRSLSKMKPLDTTAMLPQARIQRKVTEDESQADANEQKIAEVMSQPSTPVVQRDIDLGQKLDLDVLAKSAGGSGDQSDKVERQLETVQSDVADVQEQTSVDILTLEDAVLEEEEDEEEIDINLDSLARKVYPVIRRLISLERERTGKM